MDDFNSCFMLKQKNEFEVASENNVITGVKVSIEVEEDEEDEGGSGAAPPDIVEEERGPVSILVKHPGLEEDIVEVDIYSGRDSVICFDRESNNKTVVLEAESEAIDELHLNILVNDASESCQAKTKNARSPTTTNRTNFLNSSNTSNNQEHLLQE